MDIIFFIGGLLLLSIALIILIYNIQRQKKSKQKLTKKILIQENNQLSELDNQIAQQLSKLKNIEENITSKLQYNEALTKIRQEELEQQINTLRVEKFKQLDLEQERRSEELENSYIQQSYQLNEDFLKLQSAYNAEIQQLSLIIEDYKQKQDVINKEIARKKEVEEAEDFYRINLSNDEISDIEVLKSIKARVHSSINIDKIIYDTYISKRVNEMIKRVLKGAEPSGIYKITRHKTGEIYIGKSTNIKNRWAQHVKTVYGVGTVSFSTLHSIMQKDGIENFTWELLEKVEKDKLSEREKYWIDFYDSKKFGLNEKEGG